jgi:hypothetical protein
MQKWRPQISWWRKFPNLYFFPTMTTFHYSQNSFGRRFKTQFGALNPPGISV